MLRQGHAGRRVQNGRRRFIRGRKSDSVGHATGRTDRGIRGVGPKHARLDACGGVGHLVATAHRWRRPARGGHQQRRSSRPTQELMPPWPRLWQRQRLVTSRSSTAMVSPRRGAAAGSPRSQWRRYAPGGGGHAARNTRPPRGWHQAAPHLAPGGRAQSVAGSHRGCWSMPIA